MENSDEPIACRDDNGLQLWAKLESRNAIQSADLLQTADPASAERPGLQWRICALGSACYLAIATALSALCFYGNQPGVRRSGNSLGRHAVVAPKYLTSIRR